jgi:outer membrane protein OmpA-like peptidoglycan-associated protein
MARLSIAPSDITFSSTGKPRIECEINLDPSFEGKTVTIAVYDRAIYLGTPAAQAEAQAAQGADKQLPLPGFMADNYMLDPVVGPPGNTGTGTNPDVKVGTGVLFVAEGVLQRTPSKKWLFRVTGRKEVSSPATPVELHLRDETGRFAKVGTIGYFADEPSHAADRTLLFRLARTGIGGGQVIAASLGRQGGGRCAAVTLHVPSASEDSSSQVGGAAIPGNFPAPAPVARALSFDLTGFYDSLDDPAKKRPVLVQINQAGRRFAGWAVDVPAQMPDEIQVGKGPKQKIARGDTLRDGRGTNVSFTQVVFAGDVNPGTSWPLTWWAPSELNSSSDPEQDLVELTVALLERCVAGRGILTLAPGASISDRNPKLLIQFDATPYGTFGPWTIVRSRQEARWPTALIDAIPTLAKEWTPEMAGNAQDYLRATQVRPIPWCYWTHVDSILSTDNSVLVDAINRWRINTGAPRRVARQEAADQVERAFAGFAGAGYETVIRDRGRAIAAASRPEFDSGKRTMLDWLELIVSDHWDEIVANPQNAGIPTEKLYRDLVHRGFVRLGIRPTGRYHYTFEFSQIHVGVHFIGGVAVGAFIVTIMKSDVIEDSGKAVIDPIFPAVRLVGMVIDAKGGAGAQISGGPGGPLVGSVTFESVAKLSPSDFESAVIKQVGVAGLKASLGGIGFTTFESDYIVVSLRNGIELATSQTDSLKFKLNLLSLKPKDIAALKASFDIATVHTALAFLQPVATYDHKVPPPDQPGGVRTLPRDVSRSTAILFDYDSAKLMARDELELRLAVDRRLFTEGDGVAGASGFASPEGRPDYNMRLSLARASAVVQAVRDAFGDALTLSKIRGLGFGEDAALRSGLLNPPGQSDDEKQRILRESASEWPRWRKVDLVVEGILIARVMGRGAGGPP